MAVDVAMHLVVRQVVHPGHLHRDNVALLEVLKRRLLIANNITSPE